MEPLQKRNKGFTLLELLIVLAIVSVVSAIGIPNFNSWRSDREVKVAAVKLSDLLTEVYNHTQGSAYPFTQVLINSKESEIVVTGHGMSTDQYSTVLYDNNNSRPTCEVGTKGDAWSDINIRPLRTNKVLLDFVDIVDSVDIVDGDTLYVYASDGIVWVENMDEGGTLAIGAPGILNNDDDAEGDNLKTYFLLEANHPITTHPEYYDADGNWKYPYPPHAVSVDVFEDGSFEYVHDGSNGLRDVIYTKTCDEPQITIETPTNKPCCTVDSIMLIFGPDNACGEGLPDYFTLEEGGTFVAETGSTGINQFMLGVTGTESVSYTHLTLPTNREV